LKKDVRQEVINDLKRLSETPLKKQAIEENILQSLFSSELWRKSRVVGVTLSMGFEFETTKVIEQGLKEGKTMCIPKTFPGRKMSFFYHDLSQVLEESKFGVLEPTNDRLIKKEDIDLLIVPGVAFNKEGYRIGFNGKTCSLVFDEQQREDIELEEHDLPVTTLFTSTLKEVDNGTVS
jgi:5-formyltetrahydrofolate cyclo-ligase